MYRNTDRLHGTEWNMRQIAADEKRLAGRAKIFMHSHSPIPWLEEGKVADYYFSLVVY